MLFRSLGPKRFLHHKGFLDAFLYFKVSSKAHGRNEELLAYWTKLREAQK